MPETVEPVYKARTDYEPAKSTPERLKKALTNPREVPRFVHMKARKRLRELKLKRLKKSHGDTYTREVQGSLMELDLTDPGISSDLALDGVREPLMTEYYQEELRQMAENKENPLVVDVGANIGYYAFMPLSLTDNAEVIAIEVDAENIRQLQHNADLNDYGDDRLKIINKGVGEESGEAELQVSERSNRHTIDGVAVQDDDYAETRTVDIEPLPALVEEAGYSMEDVDMLRMDVEGYEREIFEGIDNLKAGDGLLIQIEMHMHRLGEHAGEMVERFQDADAELVAATWKGKEVDVHGWQDVLEYRWLTLLIDVHQT